MTILEVICRTVTVQNSSDWPCSMCPFPQLRLMGVRTSYIYFSNISWTLAFWTPLQIPIWGPPLGCTLTQWLSTAGNRGWEPGYSGDPTCGECMLVSCWEALKSCRGPNDSYKTLFWWVNCKWIRNIWIKFPLMHMEWKIKGKMLGKGNFGFCQLPRFGKKSLEMFSDPTQANVAHCPLAFIKSLFEMFTHTVSQKPTETFPMETTPGSKQGFVRQSLVYLWPCQPFALLIQESSEEIVLFLSTEEREGSTRFCLCASVRLSVSTS